MSTFSTAPLHFTHQLFRTSGRYKGSAWFVGAIAEWSGRLTREPEGLVVEVRIRVRPAISKCPWARHLTPNCSPSAAHGSSLLLVVIGWVNAENQFCICANICDKANPKAWGLHRYLGVRCLAQGHLDKDTMVPGCKAGTFSFPGRLSTHTAMAVLLHIQRFLT